MSSHCAANTFDCLSPRIDKGVAYVNVFVPSPDTVLAHALLSQAVDLGRYIILIVTLTSFRIAEISISVWIHATMAVVVESFSAMSAPGSFDLIVIISDDFTFNLLVN